MIRIVVDTSAAVAFAHGSVHVGEVLREIADEHAGFAVPDLCLAKAGSTLPDDAWPMLEVLAAHKSRATLAPEDDWRDLAYAARQVGNIGRAAAMLAAVDHDAYLLTAEPDGYGDSYEHLIGV